MNTPMVQTINLTKKYGQTTALSNLNLRIDEGDCYGFIGPNGAGKTTTIKILATLLRPTWGEARVCGLSVGPVNARQVRGMIGYVPDYFGSYEDLVVREYLEFFASAYQIHGQRRKGVVEDVLSLTDLGGKADSPVNGLSRGMKQRLSLARVLLHDPKVLLLDEPASGLDPRARIEIRELLKELRRMGKTILISSHILVELADLCNKVGIIEQGELKFSGTVAEILERAKVGSILQVRIAGGREGEAAAVLEKLPGVAGVTSTPGSGNDGELRLSIQPGEIDAAEVAKQLVLRGFGISRLTEEQVNLETAFMRLTKGLVQ